LTTTRSARGKSPAAQLSDGLTPEQQLAQDLALSDSKVQAYTVGRRSEVFGVQVVGDSYTKDASECASADCRLVLIYNWDENVTVSAIVNVDARTVLDVLRQSGTHPGINHRLVEVAEQLLLNDTALPDLLGFQPTMDDMEMAPMEGNAPGTSCDGAQGCGAYTFDQNDRMLWVWVDLTDETIAGYRWTSVNPGENYLYTDTSISEGCPPSGSVDRDGWTLDHEVTGTDAMRVYNVKYNGVDVATSIKLVEWHADYGSTGYVDSTGCGGGGGGFPIYPYGDTQVLDMLDGQSQVIGFEVVQDFRMNSWGNSCNYRYEEHFQFFQDGRFRTVTGAFGKGCGTNALYRPVVRTDIAVDGDDNDTFAIWQSGQWVDQATELYRTPYSGPDGPHEFDSNGYAWRVMDQDGNGFYMEPSQVNTFGDNSRGDDNFIYVTLHKAAEGDSDLGSIGTCCNDNQVQGPNNYVNNEDIDNTNIVLWYVPQMMTDATDGGDGYYCWTLQGEPNPVTYPCFTGPMFVPVNLAETPATASFTHNGPVMLGQTAVFTNTSTGSSPITYEWNFGDGVGTSTDENPTYNYSTPGTYTVVLTATNAFGSSSSNQQIDVVSFYSSYQPIVVNGASTPPNAPGVQLTSILYNPDNGAAGEYAELKNMGSTPVNLMNWTLSNDVANVFTFPSYILQPNETVKVWTKAGTNESGNLYWNSGSGIWDNDGDNATLDNNSGQMVDTCHISGGGQIAICP
ncbi:MAG: lamin tail domain-containing protein, partial [Candidatus Promineifilaceae bacterium]